MAYINATVRDDVFVRVRWGLQVSKQTYQDRKYVFYSAPPSHSQKRHLPSAKSGCQHEQFLEFRGPQAQEQPKPKCGRDCNEREQNEKHPKLQASTKAPRYRGRVFTSASNPRRKLAPAPAPESASEPMQIATPLDGWMVHALPTRLSKEQKSAIHSYLDIIALRSYPYDWYNVQSHNSRHASETYKDIIQDESLLPCVVSIGTVNEVVRHRTTDAAASAYYCAHLCATINALIQAPQNRSREVVIMHGIVALALLSLMMEDYGQWHIHMKGLQTLMTRAGDSLPRNLKWLAIRTDLIGSCELAVRPYISMEGCHPSRVINIAKHVRADFETSVRRTLSSCCHDASLETFISIALLCHTMRPSQGGSATLDQDSLMERTYTLWSELLSWPIPMWELQKYIPAHDASQNGDPWLRDTAPEHVSLPESVAAAYEFPQCIETAMRLALLLYAKTMVPYHADLIWKRPSLLTIYTHCMHQILIRFQQPGEGEGEAQSSTDETCCSEPSFETLAATVRPALIWLCLMGWTSNQMIHGSASDAAIVRELLVRVIGSSADDIDASVSESDLEFCRIYNLKDILGDSWELKKTIKSIIESPLF
ncbi:hypothetical protein BX600DRAFT_556115 [Xylariales sp. PMI_506]|nr:hypothetical protein BX600DRAFT_556115 [Xylariales sp. PMI_506]